MTGRKLFKNKTKEENKENRFKETRSGLKEVSKQRKGLIKLSNI
jgi:hypothetical protein